MFTGYRKYKELDISKRRIVKLDQQMGRTLIGDGPHAIHKILFRDILKIETPS